MDDDVGAANEAADVVGGGIGHHESRFRVGQLGRTPGGADDLPDVPGSAQRFDDAGADVSRRADDDHP